MPVMRSEEAAPRATRMAPPRNSRLERMRFLSRLLDNSIPLPGGYRVGLDPVMGLLPGVGDFLGATLSLWLIYDAARLGLKKRVLALMLGNVLMDSVAGSVPVIGDLVDAAWKANARNMRLVEKHHSPTLKERSLAGMAAWFLGILLVFYGTLFGLLYLVFSLIRSLFTA